MTASDEELGQVVTQLQERLARSGWKVSILRSDRNVGQLSSRAVIFEHPLASPVRCGIWDSHTGPQVKRFLEEQLDSREFRVVAAAPQHVVHSDVLIRLREATATFHWSPEQLEQVVSPLVASGVLTEAEAEWVVTAGPTPMRPGATWKT
jgi:hypothetical protein